MNLVMTCGWPAEPSTKTTNQDSEPIMPSVPHGVIVSGSSSMSVVTMPVSPPSTTLSAATKTNTAATIMIAPCTRSVYTDARMPSVTQ